MRGKSIDTPFLLVFLTLVVFGLLIFTSAALGLLARDGASFTSVAVNQLLFGFLCGGIALIILSRIDSRVWRPYTPYFFVAALFLVDPETGDDLIVVSPLQDNMDGSSSFVAQNPKSGTRWKHIIRTEEVK